VLNFKRKSPGTITFSNEFSGDEACKLQHQTLSYNHADEQKIILKNRNLLFCDDKPTIFDAAKNSGMILEHSRLKARCRSYVVLIEIGSAKDKLEVLVLSSQKKSNQ
jgi:hypothetical protein